MCSNALLMSQQNIYSPSSMAHSNIEIGKQKPKMFSVLFQNFFFWLFIFYTIFGPCTRFEVEYNPTVWKNHYEDFETYCFFKEVIAF